MKKIAVFYHLYQINDWAELFLEQFARVKNSGLLDAASYIHIGINGDQPLPYLDMSGNKLERLNVVSNLYRESEADTLVDLWKFSKARPDYKILYFHSKGVTHLSKTKEGWVPRGSSPYVQGWREYLEYFNIDKWRVCSDHLDHYDCAGTEWVPPSACVQIGYNTHPHYSGNFWWGTADYISTLDLSSLYSNKNNCEKWIATKNPNYFSFWFSNRDLYWHPLDVNEYRSVC